MFIYAGQGSERGNAGKGDDLVVYSVAAGNRFGRRGHL